MYDLKFSNGPIKKGKKKQVNLIVTLLTQKIVLICNHTKNYCYFTLLFSSQILEIWYFILIANLNSGWPIFNAQ
jgi:hypothetical protein